MHFATKRCTANLAWVARTGNAVAVPAPRGLGAPTYASFGEQEEPNAVRRIRDGTTRGLSLGTDMILTEDGSVISRIQKECSVCVEGKRNNTTIDTINGALVHQVACHSKDRDSALHHIEP